MRKNPKLPLDTIIDGSVPLASLPQPPAGRQWAKQTLKKFKYRKVKVQLTYLDYLLIPYKKKGKRRYYRAYYPVSKIVLRRKRYVSRGRFWALVKRVRVRQDWLDLSYALTLFERERDIDRRKVRLDKLSPYPYVERRTRYNSGYKILPAITKEFDLLFLNYFIRVCDSPTQKEKGEMFVLEERSFDLGENYDFNTVQKVMIPQAIKQMKKDMLKNKHMTYIDLFSWTGVLKKKLEGGKKKKPRAPEGDKITKTDMKRILREVKKHPPEYMKFFPKGEW